MEDRLQKFAQLVEIGSFTAAAAVLHISQPALTTAIKKLERELRAELLVRGNRKLHPTAAGQLAYQAAITMRLQVANLTQQLAELQLQPLNLRLGMIDSMAQLTFAHSNVAPQPTSGLHLALTVDNSTRLIDYLSHDRLDLVLCAKQPHLPQGLTQTELGREPLLLVAHASGIAQLSKQVLHKKIEDFLSYDQHSRTAHIVHDHFAKQDIALVPQFYSTSPEIILQLVLAGQGVAVLPYLSVKEHITNHTLGYVAAGQPAYVDRPIVTVQRTGRVLPAAVQALLRATRQQLSSQQAATDTLYAS
jgi:DNA-binding transcriptional LysR family regulator